MSYRIGSFNVRNLSLDGKRDLDRIASIILENKLDIVALQEVLGEGKVLTGSTLGMVSGQARAYEMSLKRRLPGNWGIRWGDPQSRAKDSTYLGGDARGEGYAFLWNADKFELPHDENGNEIAPKIWRNYRPNVEEGQRQLIRDPFYGRFKVKNLKAEIRLITTHIIYGKPKAGRLDDELDLGAFTMRQNEFKILAGQIYPRISEYYKTIDCNAPYTIMLGDYNLNLKSSGIGKAVLQDCVCFDSKGRIVADSDEKGRAIVTVQHERTTLKSEEPGYASNYDHFSFDRRVQRDIVSAVSVIDAVNQHPGAEDVKFDTYRDKVSDHIPIVIEIEFK